MDFNHFKVLTFDCYGTLIDWETGILSALRPVFAAHAPGTTDNSILRAYAEVERALEAGPYQTYRRLLAGVVAEMGSRCGFTPTVSELDSLAGSIRQWLPFPDTVNSLKRLRSRYRLGILSNIDDDLFAQSAERLEVEFDLVVTAQQVGTYKPATAHFIEGGKRIEGLGISRYEWLHVAQSKVHDIAPASAMGIANVWVDRPQRYGASAVTETPVKPDLTLNSLDELADLSS